MNLNNGLFWYLHVCFVHLSNRLSCRSETWLVLYRPCWGTSVLFSMFLKVEKWLSHISKLQNNRWRKQKVAARYFIWKIHIQIRIQTPHYSYHKADLFLRFFFKLLLQLLQVGVGLAHRTYCGEFFNKW